MNIEAVIFDFGGVLYEIDYHAPVHAFEKLGCENFDSLYSKAQQSEIFDLLETGKVDGEYFYDYMQTLIPHATRSELEHAWNCILLKFLPERMPFIHWLKKRGIRTFLFSNTNAIHSAIFEQDIESVYGLQNFYAAFEKVYYSQNLGYRKPHAESFQALCLANKLNTEKTIFIDDSPQHVLGACEAGLIGILHDPKEMPEKTLQAYFPNYLIDCEK
jgi:putative hydrolase of the HAD superfamily